VHEDGPLGKQTLPMPAGDYALEVIAAGIVFGIEPARQPAKAPTPLRDKNPRFPAGAGESEPSSAAGKPPRQSAQL
jgi:hypothetical protein